MWKTVYEGPDKVMKRKPRVVVDIRGLNRCTTSDSHPLPRQEEVISLLRGMTNISLLDGLAFFLQFGVQRDDWHKQTVISHRGREYFKVAAMGYKGSPPYVQRIMDKELRAFKDFVKAYIDDIVAFSESFDKHLDHLTKLFQLLVNLRVTISPKKTFLNYPSVTLLGQRVDAFGLAITEERIEAIAKLDFPTNLKALEHYLGLTGWMRNKVPYYAQKAEPLQREKTLLLKKSPAVGGQRRQHHTKTTLIEKRPILMESFRLLQESFTSPNFLVHCDPQSRIYVDLDASKERGFGVHVYHVKGNPEVNDFNKSDMMSILFLSKSLNGAEQRYWPTELEVAGLVWTIRKIRHLIDGSPLPTIVYTDHSATASIVRHTSLRSSSVDKLNLRLVRASQYLSQFNLDVRHKPGKQHTVPDALSRLMNLSAKEKGATTSDEGTLDEVSAFNEFLVEMSSEFKESIQAAYLKDKHWSKIRNSLKSDVHLPGIQFHLHDGLIYYTDFIGRIRLCLPKAFEKEIFHRAHDSNAHTGFNRTYEVIISIYFFRKLTRRLHRYIHHCHECNLNQTKRHATYGSLNPIVGPPLPHHTVAVDFILGLPPNPDGMDAAMSVTCKFSKRNTVVPGKENYTAEEWADAYLDATVDWGLPAAFISDRDRKFMSAFWKAVFKRLGTKFLTSSAYHPQTDGQSERTNQTVEIALRFWLTSNPDADWVTYLPRLRGILNNLPNASTGLSPNEVIYGYRVRDTLSSLAADDLDDYVAKRTANARDAEEAIAWANLQSKITYDAHHRPITLKEGSEVFLKLHQGYTLPGVKNRKFANQRAGPFKILERIGNLAYKLDIPPHWKIHPVISITQLEPAPKGDDPYKRTTKPDHPPPVAELNDDWQECAIEKLVGRRQRKYGRGKPLTEYLVRWEGWGPEWDLWYGEDLLEDAKKLVKDYDSRHTKEIKSAPIVNATKRGRGRPRRYQK